MPTRTDARASPTEKIAVWDIPVRIAHWLIVLLFLLSWWSAETVDETLRTPWGDVGHERLHMWSGYAMLAVLSFRLLWGIAGSSTARFSNFVTGPRRILDYLQRARRWNRAGHTPLGALSVIVLLGLLGLQIAMGLILRDGDGIVYGPLAFLVDEQTNDLAMETHEALFNVLLSFVALHIGAIIFYRVVRRKRLLRAMISGKGDYPPETVPMRSATTGALIGCLVAALAFTWWIMLGAPPLQ